MTGLQKRIGAHPYVGELRGRGPFAAVEFVADQNSKQPFDSALRLNARFKQEALERGLMTYAMASTLDGERGDHVVLAPPFT